MDQNHIRVILADDHAVVRAGIRQFLERVGDIVVVEEADDGKQAMELIEKHRPDVAVLDIQMPGATGIEVTRWVRANISQTGVLVLTAYDDAPYVLAVLQAGANGYVLKTASPAEIIQAVRDVHAGKVAVHAAITHKLVDTVRQNKIDSIASELSGRELEVLAGIARGLTNKAIAVQLGISDRTVQVHIAHIFQKLNAASRTEAVMKGISLKLIPQSMIDQA